MYIYIYIYIYIYAIREVDAAPDDLRLDVAGEEVPRVAAPTSLYSFYIA